MKVLLVIPTSNYANKYPSFLSVGDFPVGFAYLASALKSAGHKVFGLNPNNDVSYGSAFEMLSDKLNSFIMTHPPDLIGIGGLSKDFAFLRDCIQIIRKTSPNIPIVMGGGIINHDAEYIFQRLSPDFCIIGEGEETIVQLAGSLESGEKNFEDIFNIGYWENNSPKFTKRTNTYPALNSRPFPDYEPFGINDMLDNYSFAAQPLFRYTRLDPRPMSIVTARGCPFSCTFCVHHKDHSYRTRSIENIMQEIALLYDRYRFNSLLILDELFVANKSRFNEFINAILEGRKKYGWDFDWLFQTHASSSLDEKTLALARQARCYVFFYGLESASPTVLASMNKKTKQSQIVEAIRIADSVKIGFGGSIIFGDVAETTQTICETMDFFYAHCRDIQSFLGYIQPYPGSKIFDYCLEKGLIKNKDEYYERKNLVYNMTTMPDYIWYPWLIYLFRHSGLFGWVRAVKASIMEKEETSNPIARYYGQNMFKVKATCPYCGHENNYRELLTVKKEKNKFKFSHIGGKIEKAADVWHVGLLWPFILSVFLTPFLFLFNPAFKKLSYLKAKERFSNLSFVTGCKNCNKRIRVVCE
jgi:radical SAM superfamily enzyme YgiQ (UPF0313 family)